MRANMAASRVQQFLEEAGCRKRPAPAGGEQPPAKQLLLPVYLFLEHGKLEAREVRCLVRWGAERWK